MRIQLESRELIYANLQKALCVWGRRTSLVWHLRDILSADHFSSLLRRITVVIASAQATRVVVNSQATADAFIDAGGDSARVWIVYNGIDPQPFDADDMKRVGYYRSSVSDDGPLYGVFGRLTEWKGQHIALEAVARIPGAHLWIVGDALFGEKAYRDLLIARAQEPDLRGRVRFFGHQDDIPTMMKSVDVIIHASVAPEAFGRVVIEGLMAGKPVVATRAGGFWRLSCTKLTGLLYPPGDVDTLVEMLTRLGEDSELFTRLVEQGCAMARIRFSPEKANVGIVYAKCEAWTAYGHACGIIASENPYDVMNAS